MANDFTNIMPKILARGLLAFRPLTIMPQIVNTDYSQEAAQKGDVINIPISKAMSTQNVTPSNVLPAPTDNTPGNVQITLANWKKNDPFYLTDKELVQIDKNNHFIPLSVQEAIKALANDVNGTIHAEYKGVYGFVGTAGTTPFATTVNAATDARKTLNKQLAPKRDRRGVVNFDAEANMLALDQFSSAEKIGTADIRIEGEIGRKYGIDWYAEDEVKTHTNATTGTIVTNTGVGALTAGVQTTYGFGGSVGISGVTGNPVAGDIFTVAGDTQTYVVVTYPAGASGVMTFMPEAKVAWTNTSALTFKASHVVNLAFHRDAFAFATRPLLQNSADLALGNQLLSMQDPLTGMILRLEVMRQYKQTMWEFDILWGAKMVRPAGATRIAG